MHRTLVSAMQKPLSSHSLAISHSVPQHKQSLWGWDGHNQPKAAGLGLWKNLWSAGNQLLSVEVAGFLATSTFRVTIKHAVKSTPTTRVCTGTHWLPECLLQERGLRINARTISPPPWFCKTSKIQLVMPSLFFYILCSWFHAVTNAAQFWISAVKDDCPNACRKQKAKWCNHGQGEFIYILNDHL